MNYSNTAKLYDFLPKYVQASRTASTTVFSNRSSANFECRGKRYLLTVHPARIKPKSGVQKEFYLSKRKEIVEDALRKIAVFAEVVYLDKKIGTSLRN